MWSLILLLISILSIFCTSQTTSTHVPYIEEDKTFNVSTIVKACVPKNFSFTSDDPFSISTPCPECKAFFVRNTLSTTIPVLISVHLPLLEFFIFEDSKLTEIRNNSLSNLTELIEISFHRNLLTEVTNGAFSDNKKLKKISLDSNRISKISENAFSGLLHLREVYLNDNEILELPAMLFMENPELIVVNLELNDLKELPVSLFHGLEHLKELNVNFNSLKELPDNLLVDNKELEKFYAANNVIEIIGLKNLEVFKILKVVSLLNNECLKGLSRGYDLEDLEREIKEKCKPVCDDEKKWLERELDEIRRTKRNTGGDFEDIRRELIEEALLEVENRENYAKKQDFDNFKKFVTVGFEKMNNNLKTTEDDLRTEVTELKRVEDDIDELEKTVKDIKEQIAGINEKIENLEESGSGSL